MTETPAEPPAASTSKKKRNWLIAGVLGAVVLLLCCVGGAGGIYWLTRPDSPEKVVDNYLTALQTHDDTEALALTCRSSSTGLLGALNDLIKTNTEILSWKILSSETRERTATVAVDVEYSVPVLSDGSRHARITYKLFNQDGDWLVCGATGNKTFDFDFPHPS